MVVLHGTPKSSIVIEVYIININHPFWGTPYMETCLITSMPLPLYLSPLFPPISIARTPCHSFQICSGYPGVAQAVDFPTNCTELITECWRGNFREHQENSIEKSDISPSTSKPARSFCPEIVCFRNGKIWYMFHLRVFLGISRTIFTVVGFPSQPCLTGDLLEAHLEVCPQPRAPTKLQPEDRGQRDGDAGPKMPGVVSV